MKKLMVLVTVLAMMLAMAAPAFAQEVNTGDSVEFNAVSQNLIGSVGGITTGDNTANANATATTTASADGNEAGVAVHNSAVGGAITQDSGVTISQSNEVGNLFFGHWVFFF